MYRKSDARSYKKRQKEKSKAGIVLLPLIPVTLCGAYSYARLTGDTAFEDKTGLLAVITLFLAIYVFILIVAAIIKADRLAGASLKKIDKMSGTDFEKCLALMYRRHGYKVRMTPSTSDYGADLIVTSKDGIKTAVQAKRYRYAVGEAAVQQVVAAREYYGCDNAMVVTNSSYTRQATELADMCGVTLISRKTLGTNAMYL